MSLKSSSICQPGRQIIRHHQRFKPLTNIKPTPNTYSSIWKSIQRLAGTRIDLELSSGKGRKRNTLREMTGSILSFADMDAGQTVSRLQSKIRAGLVELKQRGYLETFELTKDHRVIIKKSGKTAVSFDGQILNPAKIP